MTDKENELTEADFAKLEKLVARIQQQLAPDAEVLHNVKLPGRHSGRDRQIDVLMKNSVGQYEILIVIDCKDYKAPVDVKGVEEFWGLVDDVGGQKGVLVCPRGFSKSAKARAQKLQIDLYSPVDTDPHKWQARVTMPAICDFRSAAISFGVSMSSPLPFVIRDGFFDQLVVESADGRKLGTCYETAIRRWNKGEWSVEPGEHDRVPIFAEPNVRIDNGYGTMVSVDLDVGLHVKQELYYGQYPISRISGFKDEISGGIITNAFEVGLLDPNEVSSKWKKISDLSEAPVPPVFTMIGLMGWIE
ncbi:MULTISPECIES: restriction endonuclease [Devosia]|uniref:restriction endonuclease n=1 Tax=Devosia TaxID=46913 RepID=UPI000CE984FE|nr:MULTISPECIES: restriction endonuclease [Devosia]AVF03797.1 hypothetical protein C4375_08710 [Devosia sp. I507]